MKDYIGTSQWWNRPLENPTQNWFTRFLKMPYTEIKTPYTKLRDEIEKFDPSRIKTVWSEWWD